MFIRAENGIVNLLLANSIEIIEPVFDSNSYAVMACFLFDNNDSRHYPKGELRLRLDLYVGTKENCQKYMAELEKELAAFGKLVRVELPADSEKCTCGKGLDIEPPDHDPKCSFFVPF